MDCLICLEPDVKFIEEHSNIAFCGTECQRQFHQLNLIDRSQFDDMLQEGVPSDLVRLILNMIPIQSVQGVNAVARALEETDNANYMDAVLHAIERFPQEDVRIIFVLLFYNACSNNLPRLLQALFRRHANWRADILNRGLKRSKSIDIICALLARGADPTGTVMEHACWNNNVQLVAIFLQRIPPTLVYLKGTVSMNAINVFRLLLLDGRLVPNVFGQAVRLGRPEMVRMLLDDYRIDIFQEGNPLMQAIDYAPHPSLADEWDYGEEDEYALRSKQYGDVIEVLLKDNRIDPSADDNKALIYAVKKSFLNGVHHLLQDKRVNPAAQNGKALLEAMWANNIIIFTWLLETGKFSRDFLRRTIDETSAPQFEPYTNEIETYLTKTQRNEQGVSETKKIKERIIYY